MYAKIWNNLNDSLSYLANWCADIAFFILVNAVAQI